MAIIKAFPRVAFLLVVALASAWTGMSGEIPKASAVGRPLSAPSSGAGAASATSELQGPEHNAYLSESLGGPLHQLWSQVLPTKASYVLESAGRVFVQSHYTLYALSALDGRELWAVDMGGPIASHVAPASMAVEGNVLVTAGRRDGRVVAYDVATGRPRWTLMPAAKVWLRASAAVVPAGDGLVYLTWTDGGMEARTAATGALLWRIGSSRDRLAYHDGTIVTNDGTCGVRALDASDGSQRWQSGHDCSPSDPVAGDQVIADGRVYGDDGVVYAMTDGQVLGSWASDVAPVQAGSHLLTLTSGDLTSVDARTQAPEWSFDGDGAISGQMFVAGTTVYAVSAKGRLYELDLSTGLLKDEHAVPPGYANVPGTYDVTASMSVGDGMLVIPSGHVVTTFGRAPYAGIAPQRAPSVGVTLPGPSKSYDVGNYLGSAAHNDVMGSQALPGRPHFAWSRALNGHVTNPLITRRRVVAASYTRGEVHVYAFSRATGAQLWHRRVRGGGGAFLAGAGGQVYVQTRTGILVDFDLVTGRRHWAGQMVEPRERAWDWKAPLTVYQDTLYSVASGLGGTVFAVNLKTGAARWLARTAGIDGGIGAVAVAGGRLLYSEACQRAALGRAHGIALWHTDQGCSGSSVATAVVHRGMLYAMGDGGTNATVGVKRGRAGTAYTADREPVAVGNLLITASQDALRAENLSTHRIIWEHRESFPVPPVVVGRTVLAVRADGTVVQYAAATGRRLWRSRNVVTASEPGDFDAVTAAAAAHGVLVIPEGDRLVVFAS